MQEASYFQLLNPMVMALFAAGFYLIHRHDGKSKSALWYTLTYAVGAIGFTVDFTLRDLSGPSLGPYVSNVWLVAIPALMTCGIATQFGRPLPIRSVTFVYVLSFVLATLFLFVWPIEAARVLMMNGGTGLLLALALPMLYQARHKPLAKLLFVLFLLTSLQMFIRPIFVIAFDGLGAVPGAYSLSLYAVTLHFTSAICAISIAATLMFSLAIDMVRRLNRRSDTDPLTDLMNRRGFEKGVDQMLSRLERAPLPVSLIVCDIDHFKRVNDSYGHAVGDKVIKAFAHLIGDSVRKTDCTGRIGGEEFCILLWNSDGVAARMVAEGMRTKFNTSQFGYLPENERLSASFGVAEWKPGMSYEQWFAQADAALYLAKRSGRNRVEFSPRLISINSAA